MSYRRGIITAIVTPLNRDGSLCEDCLKNIIEFQASAGVRGLYLTGTAGEGVILPSRVRMRVYEKAMEYAPSGMYLLPHVGGASLDVVLELSRAAKDCGYREVSLIAPIFHKPSRRGLVEFFWEVSSKTDLDIVVYNNKNRQGYNISPDDFQAVASSARVIGIKDASKDPDQLLELVKRFSDKYFVAGAGDELLFYTFVVGAHAHVCAVSNVVPELAVSLHKKIEEGKIGEALELQHRISALRRYLGRLTSETQEALRELMRVRNVDPGYPPVQMVHDFDPKVLSEAKGFLSELLRELRGS